MLTLYNWGISVALCADAQVVVSIGQKQIRRRVSGFHRTRQGPGTLCQAGDGFYVLVSWSFRKRPFSQPTPSDHDRIVIFADYADYHGAQRWPEAL
jgi:hypothetical protein